MNTDGGILLLAISAFISGERQSNLLGAWVFLIFGLDL